MESTTYYENGLVESTTQGTYTTTYAYDQMGRPSEITLPGTDREIERTYNPLGLIVTESGTATYPISYAYDPQGRLTMMTTSSGVTTWQYDPQTGLLSAKVDDLNEATTYSYTSTGRLARRTWARGVTTDYTYNPAGDLIGIDYSDGTPSITFTRDTRGRVVGVEDATGPRTIKLSDQNQILGETFATGSINEGLSTTFTYDPLQRRTSSQIGSSTDGLLSEVTYTHDNASRLRSVGFHGNEAVYTYADRSALIESLTIENSGGSPVTTTRTYDNLNRVTTLVSTTANGDRFETGYAFDEAGRRSQVGDASGNAWLYDYNPRSEVTIGEKVLPDNTLLSGYEFGYAYDDLGNRTWAERNGRVSNYFTNSLNQYTERSVPPAVDLLGSADPAATLTAESGNPPTTGALTRQNAFFHAVLEAPNSGSPNYLPIKVRALLASAEEEETGHLFVPPDPEQFAYDQDGNLIRDGRWLYRWNGENRLIEMETTLAAVNAGAPQKLYEFVYDYQGRRTAMTESTWTGADYTPDQTTRFLYDGWNLLAEIDEANHPLRTYAWGTDLSGTMQGAGGVGGLLFLHSEGTTHTYRPDGNGNILNLIETNTGTPTATYDYSPFGKLLRSTGPVANDNPFRFSTKYQDPTGLNYYGLRYYNPETGRWLSRDPLGDEAFFSAYTAGAPNEELSALREEALKNPFLFADNSAINNIDPFGLAVVGIYGYGPGEDAPPIFVNVSNNTLRAIAESGGGRAFGRSEDGAIRQYLREEYKNNPLEPIVIVGYSRGAIKAVELARWILKQKEDKTNLECAKIYLVGIDPVTLLGSGPVSVPSGVEHWTSYHQKNGPGGGLGKVLTLRFYELNGTPYSGGSGTPHNLTGFRYGSRLVNHADMPDAVRSDAISTIQGYLNEN